MNISSLNLFKILKNRAIKLRNWKNKPLEQPKVPEKVLDVDLKGYTLVDPTPHGRKLDLATNTALGGRHLDQATAWQKQGKAHWLIQRNTQTYKPKQARIDPQLEYIYEELGLAENMEITTLGTNPQQAAN